MNTSHRTRTLSELREIRNGLETQYDRLRDMNLSSLPQAKEMLEKLGDALYTLKGIIDTGEDCHVYIWPK